ncbi:hypothetical protein PZR16_004881, partial [Salmonella enterica]|nr:hypothetical protein [Salmonella enterica]
HPDQKSQPTAFCSLSIFSPQKNKQKINKNKKGSGKYRFYPKQGIPGSFLFDKKPNKNKKSIKRRTDLLFSQKFS